MRNLALFAEHRRPVIDILGIMDLAMPRTKKLAAPEMTPLPTSSGLWDLGITELTGHNVETQGREEVNALLKKGWILLHMYTLKYREDGTWRERPMVILGKPKTVTTAD